MVIINQDKCIGCGLCVDDCCQNNLNIKNGIANVITESCLQCGHCVAICPEGAVMIDDYDMDNVSELGKEFAPISPESLLASIKAKRSIRHFKDMFVESQKLKMIIEAGRYTPTAVNRQELSYIVVEEKMSQFRPLALKSLAKKSELILESEDTKPQIKYASQRAVNIYQQYLKDPKAKDSLFFNAPALILIAGDSTLDVGLAASSMGLMAFSLGLGSLYSGFIVRACQDNDEIRSLLSIKQGHDIIACLLVGYTDVKYVRTAPRKKPDVSFQ